MTESTQPTSETEPAIRRLATESEIQAFLSDFCRFGEGRAFILAAIARPKENDHLGHGDAPMFREIARDETELREKARKLITLARHFRDTEGRSLTFRLYITANGRDTEAARFNFRHNLTELERQLANGHGPASEKLARLDREWQSALQGDDARADRRFLIDIDDADPPLEEIRAALEDRTTIHTGTETPNGFHFITDPFNPNADLGFPDTEIEIKRDAMLFLALFPPGE